MSKEAKLGLVCLLCAPLAWWLQGACLSVLWSWFVVPLGFAPLGVAHGAGLALVARYLTHQTRHDPRPKFDRDLESLAVALLGPVFALGLGFILHAVMA